MKNKEIQENTFGGIVKLRQDIDNSTYQLFQRLEESPTGEIIDTFISGNKKIEIEISYNKTPDKKVSRTTADLEILLAALLTQNNFDRTISNITMKDLLFYLNKEYSKQNYNRLKIDLKILKTMNRNIIAEEFEEIGDAKAPKKHTIRMQSIVIEELLMDSRSRKVNWIRVSETFVDRVKEKFIVHLPPKEVFFSLNSNEKNVCERLIAILRPRGRGQERKFGLTVLRKTLDDFTIEVLGHKYKHTQKKKEAIIKVLNNLNFLVKKFTLEKEKSRRHIYVTLYFFSYDEYIQNVERLRKDNESYEEIEKFPKAEINDKNDRNNPQIYYDILNEGVSETKINSILDKEFEIIKENKEAVEKSYIDKELDFISYLKAKYIIAKLYADKEKVKGSIVSFEAVLMRALQYNWGNKQLEESERKHQNATVRKEREEKINFLENKKIGITEKWNNEIEPAIKEIIDNNPGIVDEILNGLIRDQEFYLPTYDTSKTALENYQSKMFIRAAVDENITRKYKNIKTLTTERDKEIEIVNKEISEIRGFSR